MSRLSRKDDPHQREQASPHLLRVKKGKLCTRLELGHSSLVTGHQSSWFSDFQNQVISHTTGSSNPQRSKNQNCYWHLRPEALITGVPQTGFNHPPLSEIRENSIKRKNKPNHSLAKIRKAATLLPTSFRSYRKL